MADTKLSQIASGSSVIIATDQIVAVRSGTTDVLVALGTLASQSGTFSGTSSGTNTGDQTSVSGNAGTVTTINGRLVQGTNVTITGSGTAGSPYNIASSGGSAALNPTAVKTANYNPLAGELALYDTTSGSLTGTLPVTPADQTIVEAKMVTLGGTNTVTISAGGSAHFNTTGGSTTATLKLSGQAMTFQYIASSSVWVITSADVPLGQLDIRYPLLQSALYAIGNAGATPAINWANGRVQSVNWNTATPTVTFTDPTYLANFELHCTNTSGGTVAITWPSNVKGPAATRPQPTTGASAKDIFSFNWDGTNYVAANAYPNWS